VLTSFRVNSPVTRPGCSRTPCTMRGVRFCGPKLKLRHQRRDDAFASYLAAGLGDDAAFLTCFGCKGRERLVSNEMHVTFERKAKAFRYRPNFRNSPTQSATVSGEMSSINMSLLSCCSAYVRNLQFRYLPPDGPSLGIEGVVYRKRPRAALVDWRHFLTR
jgi:hypothetical protein